LEKELAIDENESLGEVVMLCLAKSKFRQMVGVGGEMARLQASGQWQGMDLNRKAI
jgi:hypothetical protein